MSRENCDISCGLAGTYFKWQSILGAPAAVIGGGKKPKRVRKKFGRIKEEALLHVLDFSWPDFFFSPARLNFFPPPLTAPGAPRMDGNGALIADFTKS